MSLRFIGPEGAWDTQFNAQIVRREPGSALVRVSVAGGLCGALPDVDLRVEFDQFTADSDIACEALLFLAGGFGGFYNSIIAECVRARLALAGMPANQEAVE